MAAEEDARTSHKVVADLESSKEELLAEHAVVLEEQRKMSRAQCDQVRNETIAAAEEQFRKANEHYMSLKQEYDGAITKIGKLEKELRSVRRECENAKSETVPREAAMASEIAQSKAGKCGSPTHFGADRVSNERVHPAIAASEASIARMVKEFQAKIETLQTVQRDVQSKLEDANIAGNAANLSRAAVVQEKEKLIKENMDLNAVCEELMAMVEGGQAVSK